VAALTPAEGQLFSELISGKSLGEAAELVLEAAPAFDFAAAFARVVSGGGFADVSLS